MQNFFGHLFPLAPGEGQTDRNHPIALPTGSGCERSAAFLRRTMESRARQNMLPAVPGRALTFQDPQFALRPHPVLFCGALIAGAQGRRRSFFGQLEVLPREPLIPIRSYPRVPAGHGKGWACFGFGPGNQSADLEARRPGAGPPARPQHPGKRSMIGNNRTTTVTNLFDAAPQS
jgi:hypothetical protein